MSFEQKPEHGSLLPRADQLKSVIRSVFGAVLIFDLSMNTCRAVNVDLAGGDDLSGTYDEVLGLFREALESDNDREQWNSFERDKLSAFFLNGVKCVKKRLHPQNVPVDDGQIFAVALCLGEQEKLNGVLIYGDTDCFGGWGSFEAERGLERDEYERRRYYSELTDKKMPVFSIVYDMEGKRLIRFMRGELLHEYGYSEDDFLEFYKNGLNGLIYEKDLEKIQARVLGAGAENAGKYETEYRVYKKNGEIAWVMEQGRRVMTYDGAPAYLSTMVDITRRKKCEEELRMNNQETMIAIRQSDRILARYIFSEDKLYLSHATAQCYHLPAVIENPMAAVPMLGIIMPDSLEEFKDIFRQVQSDEKNGKKYLHLRFESVRELWCEVKYSLAFDDAGRRFSAIVSFLDVTRSHESEMAYERYRQSMAQDIGAHKNFFEVDVTGDRVEKQGGSLFGDGVQFVGKPYSALLGWISDHLAARQDCEQVSERLTREKMICVFAAGDRSLTVECQGREGEGIPQWLRISVQMISDPFVSTVKAYIQLQDISDEKLAGQELKRRAERDGMTDLFNKATTEEKIARALLEHPFDASVMLIIDIDDLKGINDRFGHAQGDAAIIQVAQAVKRHFRSSDIVGRVGGDEFMAFFMMGKPTPARLQAVVSALMGDLLSLKVGETGEMQLQASVGVTTGNAGEETFESLYKKADTALYQVKRGQKGHYAFYQPDMELSSDRCDKNGITLSGILDNSEEVRILLDAVAYMYPLVILVNLTRNSYSMVEYDHFTARACACCGTFDQLIKTGASTISPEDRELFVSAFSRDSLLLAHARGQKSVRCFCRQKGDDGVYRNVETTVVFVRAAGDDVYEVTLSRNID